MISMNKLSLKWKIFSFLIIFCTLLLVILWLFQTVFLDATYKSIKTAQIKSGAKVIANNFNNDNIIDVISSISQKYDVCIEITNTNTITVYSCDVLRDCIIHKMSPVDKFKRIITAQENNNEYIERINSNRITAAIPGHGVVSAQPAQSLVYVRLFEASSGESYAVFMNSIISPVDSTVMTLRFQLYCITVVMIILSIILAFIISKYVAKPIEQINKSAKVLSRGKYDIKFKGRGYREIDELSDTLNKAATELSKVDRQRRELMANISHDLRTPLSLIYGYAEVMHDFPEEITKENAFVIMSETQRLTSLVNDVLDISRLEDGIQKLNLSKFNLTQNIKNITSNVDTMLKKDGYNIEFIYDSDVFVSADEIKINQVFYNLIANAVNYTGNDKSVIIRQIISGGSVRIEVEDTGEGIAKEDLQYIWDRYYKIDKNHKRAVTGTGLGLSIVKKVIALHKGKCGAWSGIGKGSVFWFSLDTNIADADL